MPFLICDLETTGLSLENDRILEACFMYAEEDWTTPQVHNFVFPIPSWKEGGPKQWAVEVVKMHTESGLLTECLKADNGTIYDLKIKDADEEMASLLFEVLTNGIYNAPVRPLYLIGNSIHFDREFLRRQFPSTHRLLHYRQIDISSITEVMKRNNETVYRGRPGANNKSPHRAIQDAQNSWELFRYYSDFFNKGII